MGLNWQHTVWNEKFSNNTDKLLFMHIADNCADDLEEYECHLEDVAFYLEDTNKQQVARILKKYHGDLIEYTEARGRSVKSKIKWLIKQKERKVRAKILKKGEVEKVLLEDVQQCIKVALKDALKVALKGGEKDNLKVALPIIGTTLPTLTTKEVVEYEDTTCEQPQENSPLNFASTVRSIPNTENKPTTEQKREKDYSTAVSTAETVLELTLPAHFLGAIEDAGIKDLSAWKNLLTEKKLGMSAEKWNNPNYRQGAVKYAIADYPQYLKDRKKEVDEVAIMYEMAKPKPQKRPYYDRETQCWRLPNQREGFRDVSYGGVEGHTLEESLQIMFGFTSEEIQSVTTATV